jgi:hypothetical protein
MRIRDYVDARISDLRAQHFSDIAMVQAEIDRRVAEIIRERDARFRKLTDGIKTASAALDHRLEAMNEFRAQMREQGTSYVRRDMLDVFGQAVNARLDHVEAAPERARGRMSVYAGLAAAAAAAVAIITLAANHIRF